MRGDQLDSKRWERRLDKLVKDARVRVAFRAIDQQVPAIVEQTLSLSRVASPTFAEHQKSDIVANEFRLLGLEDVHTDALGNVFGRRRGRGGRGAVLIAAHIDTVFSAGTVLDGRRDGDLLRGPSVGDNSLGVAAMLALPVILDAGKLATEQDLLLVADVGEEGLGDLGGMRAAMQAHSYEVASVVAIEGHTLGRVTHRAVGSRRLRVTVTGPGGHSWGDYGKPSAIHALAQLIAQLTHIPVTNAPRGTFNVGRIEGGVSVNTIAPTAWCEIDVRSEDQAELERLVGWIQGLLSRRSGPEISVQVETIGDRPAGALPADAPIVGLCRSVLQSLGVPAMLEASSTDANVPIGMGLPAVCLGVTRGGGAHRADEYVEIAAIPTGMQQLLLVVLALAGVASPGTTP